MNKKLLKSTLAVAMVAVAGYGGYKAYDGYAGSERGMNPLLTENVEALSGTENGNSTIASECPGLPIYAETYLSYGSATSRIHETDSLDCIMDYSIKVCSAYGMGKKEGDNMRFPELINVDWAPCLGAEYHYIYTF